MCKILKVRNVSDYSRYVGVADQHPLISIIDYTEVSPVPHSLNNYGVYGIFSTTKQTSHWNTDAGNMITRKKQLSA